jgi:phage terminase Nu1 subunit (DNA packaging protein)
MQAELWTLSGLAVELGRDRRALAAALEGLAPDEQETDAAGRVTRKYRMARVFEHLMGGAADLDLNAERARLAKAQADTHEANLAVRCGELLERSRVIREVGAMLASFQSRAIVIPDAVGQLLDPKTARTVVPAVREKIYEALAEMSEYRPELPSGYSEDSSASTESDSERVGGSEPQTVKRKQRGAGSVAN